MLPLDLETLRTRVHRGEEFDYHFFYGHTPRPDGRISDACFSQWFAAPFELEGRTYATAEHWMMASKARLFGDLATLEKILVAPSPAQAKKLGRAVTPFDDGRWRKERFEIVTRGNVAKFSARDELRA